MSYLGNTVVKSISDLERTSLQDGQGVFCLSMRAPWTFVQNGSALTIDGITVVSTALAGTTRWVRDLGYSDTSWRLNTSDIYIDPIAGDDQNVGIYTSPQMAPAPLKTQAEMYRRLGTPWIVTSNVNVHFASYPAIADPLRLQIQPIQDTTGSGPVVTFIAPPLTVKSSGTITALTPRNGATNTPWNVVDGTVDTSTDQNHRMRITSGARAGTRAWVALSTGPGGRRTSEWGTFDAVNFTTLVAPQVGDPYVIEFSPTSLPTESIIVQPAAGAGFDPGEEMFRLVFQDIDFQTVRSNAVVPMINGCGGMEFVNCSFAQGEWAMWTNQPAGDFTSGFTYFGNGCFRGDGESPREGIGNLHFLSGNFTDNFVEAGLFFGNLLTRQGGSAQVNFHTLGQGSASQPSNFQQGSLLIIAMGVMDFSVGGLIVNESEVGLNDDGRGNPPELWGQSSVAGSVGVVVRSHAAFRYTDGTGLTLTGAAGDFSVGGSATANAWTGTAYTTPIACTWANLIGGSLLDNAHNLKCDSHVFKNTDGSQP